MGDKRRGKLISRSSKILSKALSWNWRKKLKGSSTPQEEEHDLPSSHRNKHQYSEAKDANDGYQYTALQNTPAKEEVPLFRVHINKSKKSDDTNKKKSPRKPQFPKPSQRTSSSTSLRTKRWKQQQQQTPQPEQQEHEPSIRRPSSILKKQSRWSVQSSLSSSTSSSSPRPSSTAGQQQQHLRCRSTRTSSVRFCLGSIQVKEIPSKTQYSNEVYATLFYDEDEIAQFRYEDWEEQCLQIMRPDLIEPWDEHVEEAPAEKGQRSISSPQKSSDVDHYTTQDSPPSRIINPSLSPCGVVDEFQLGLQQQLQQQQHIQQKKLLHFDDVPTFISCIANENPTPYSKEESSELSSETGEDSILAVHKDNQKSHDRNYNYDVQTRIHDIEERILSIKQQQEEARLKEEERLLALERSSQHNGPSNIEEDVNGSEPCNEDGGYKNRRRSMDSTTSNSSCFTWTTESDNGREHDNSKDSNGAIPAMTTAEQRRSQIKIMQDKLNAIQQQSLQDKQDWKEHLHKTKVEYRQNQVRQQKKKIQNANEIQFLKDDNARLRQNMVEMRQQYVQPRLDSCKELQSIFIQSENSCAVLIEHIVELQKKQSMLEEKCIKAKMELQTQRRDYYRGCIHHKSESKLCQAYEECFSKILFRIQQQSQGQLKQGRKTRSLSNQEASTRRISNGNADLVETIEQGRDEVKNTRSNQLSTLGHCLIDSSFQYCNSSSDDESDTEDDGDSSSCDSGTVTKNDSRYEIVRKVDCQFCDSDTSKTTMPCSSSSSSSSSFVDDEERDETDEGVSVVDVQYIWEDVNAVS